MRLVASGALCTCIWAHLVNSDRTCFQSNYDAQHGVKTVLLLVSRYQGLELALHESLSAQEVLAVRQELLALARVLAHTREGPSHLLAEATMHLAAAYGCLELHTQALSHANTSVMMSHELCEFVDRWPFTAENRAPQLWQQCVHLLARLELNKYRSSHQKTDLLRALAHFEAAFPITIALHNTVCDEPLPKSIADFLHKV